MAMDMEESKQMKETILKQQIEEWRSLNDYLNKIDVGYQTIFTVFISAFVLVANLISKENSVVSRYTLMLIPFAVITVLAFVCYQFRITAILRGHLAALEEKINEEIGENVHLWNSALVDTYMANNNMVNQFMMIPMCIFLIIFAVLCLGSFIQKSGGITVLTVVYLMVLSALSLLVFIPFLNNEKVRKEVYYLERFSQGKELPEFYAYYIQKRKEDAGHILGKRSIKDRIEKKNAILNAIQWGVLVACLGFGVLFLLNAVNPNTDLPNLFSYYAATIGDGLCLPALIGFARYYAHDQYSSLSKKQKSATLLIAIICGIIGGAIQASWLINSNTASNWTIPKPHHFNIPGWIHAIYFVVMFFLVAYAVSCSVCIYKNTENKYILSTYPAIWLSGVAYVLMNTIDDRTTNTNYISVLVITGVIFVIFYIVVSAISGSIWNRNTRIFMLGVFVLVILAIMLCHFDRYSYDPVSSISFLNFLFG